MAKHSKAITTITQLAKALEYSQQNMSKVVQRDDWSFSRRPPWARSLVPKMLTWKAENIRAKRETYAPKKDDDESTTGLRKQKLENEVRKLHLQAETAEVALQKECGKLLEAAEVEREWATEANLVRNAFQNLPSQLIPLALSHGCRNEEAPAFHKEIEGIVGAILRRLSTGEHRGGEEEDAGDTLPPRAVDAQPVGGIGSASDDGE